MYTICSLFAICSFLGKGYGPLSIRIGRIVPFENLGGPFEFAVRRNSIWFAALFHNAHGSPVPHGRD